MHGTALTINPVRLCRRLLLTTERKTPQPTDKQANKKCTEEWKLRDQSTIKTQRRPPSPARPCRLPTITLSFTALEQV